MPGEAPVVAYNGLPNSNETGTGRLVSYATVILGELFEGDGLGEKLVSVHANSMQCGDRKPTLQRHLSQRSRIFLASPGRCLHNGSKYPKRRCLDVCGINLVLAQQPHPG